MDGDEDPGPSGAGPPPGKRKFSGPITVGGRTGDDCEDPYKPYIKTGYKRLYPENDTKQQFQVFIESTNNTEKIGNKSPIYLNHIFSTNIKGIRSMQRVNANKIAVIFNQHNNANNFLLDTCFLEKYNLKAYIPAKEIEITGIIRHVPTNISNTALYSKLSSKFDIISIRRFTKKVGAERVPLQTVSITFLSNILPDYVQYDLFSYRVFTYIPPLLQCFKCFKFNHSAKICNSKQKCSICAGDHLYKDCDNQNTFNCINCGGPHLAISRECPLKIKKMLEKKNKISYADVSKTLINDKEFPALKPKNDIISNKNVHSVNKNVNKPFVNSSTSVNKSVTVNNMHSRSDLERIASDETVLNAIVKSLLALANSGKEPITTNRIKDIFLSNLI